MLRSGLLYICLSFLLCGLVLGKPIDYTNPKSQVEYISVKPGDKPNIVPITRPPLIDLTPPPPPQDSKSFAFDPKTQSWTKISAHDPPPAEDALIWNQNNDKWLTQVPGS